MKKLILGLLTGCLCWMLAGCTLFPIPEFLTQPPEPSETAAPAQPSETVEITEPEPTEEEERRARYAGLTPVVWDDEDPFAGNVK